MFHTRLPIAGLVPAPADSVGTRPLEVSSTVQVTGKLEVEYVGYYYPRVARPVLRTSLLDICIHSHPTAPTAPLLLVS